MSNRTRKAVARTPIEDISRVAVAVYNVEFRGIRALNYRPREGTLMFDVWKSEKLELHQQKAWAKFVSDLLEAAGESGKVTGSYAQAVDASGNKTWQAWTNREYDRVVRLSDDYLDRRKERPLLMALILDEIQTQGVVQLERIGFHCNGYKDKAQARATGIANVCCLLDRISRFYGY